MRCSSNCGSITRRQAAIRRSLLEPLAERFFEHGGERSEAYAEFVRSNPDGDLGFVADPRRLTVALSRARRLLLCTGDTATLGAHPRFAQVLERIQILGGLQTVWEPPWSE